MIDAHDAQLAPLDQELRDYAQAPARLPGADAPLRHRAADVGHDPRRARRRAPLLAPRARPSATPAWTSPSTSPTPAAPPAASPAKDPRRCAGRSSKPRNAPAGPAHPTTTTTSQTAARLGGNRACLAVARKLLKRSYHTLRELGEEALQPA